MSVGVRLFSCCLLLALAGLLTEVRGEAPRLEVRCDFPGGSGVVEGIDHAQRVVRIAPTPHKDRGWVCWWYVRIGGIEPGETITLDVGGGKWATPDRAAVSKDNVHWEQTEPGVRLGDRIVYKHRIDAPAAWFAWGPPYLPDHAAELVRTAAQNSPHAVAFELCQTLEGRSVPAVRIRQAGLPDDERYGVWIQARQHAWECGSSWVCHGLAEWLVSDHPRAESLRKRALVTLVPIMDVDNVALGAGGKEQHPHDHNRDWSDQPHFPSVRAAMQQIQQLDAAGRFDLFIDLHNPGPNDQNPYFYVPPSEQRSPPGEANLSAFLAGVKEEMTGPLAFLGRTVESGQQYDPQRWKHISKNWVDEHTRPHVVAVTLETAWNTPHSTAENYRRVGRELGLAIERYLQTARRAPAR